LEDQPFRQLLSPLIRLLAQLKQFSHFFAQLAFDLDQRL
jgi:hypothetical protein